MIFKKKKKKTLKYLEEEYGSCGGFVRFKYKSAHAFHISEDW